MKPLADCRLYTFVDSGYLLGRDPVELASQLCGGGSDLIQLRAKDWPAERVESEARRIRPVCEAHGVRLVINDWLPVAVRTGAPVVHLGQEDFFDAGHERITDLPGLVPGLEVGLSSHAPDQARRAVAAGAHYVAIGPVFPTPTKPGRPGVTLDYVRWAAANLAHLPWFAIGGIHLGNLTEVLAAGATRICVVSAILRAPDVAAACREFRARLEEAAAPGTASGS
jgi:thiamine-phosphate pyrophosphorylase